MMKKPTQLDRIETNQKKMKPFIIISGIVTGIVASVVAGKFIGELIGLLLF